MVKNLVNFTLGTTLSLHKWTNYNFNTTDISSNQKSKQEHGGLKQRLIILREKLIWNEKAISVGNSEYLAILEKIKELVVNVAEKASLIKNTIKLFFGKTYITLFLK